jgi:hypothetical protein
VTVPRATPPDILEAYFGIELDRHASRRLEAVDEDTWVDFTRHYRTVMEGQFEAQFLAKDNDKDEEEDESLVRLYLEPRMAQDWKAAIAALAYAQTPILGVVPDPGPGIEITPERVSQMLAPLTKHLLIADSIYLRDNFYYCFDLMADSTDPETWRDDPNQARLVRDSIARLKAWVPILAGLRQLIDSRAVVFMPYYVTPSFPFDAYAPKLKEPLSRLRFAQTPPNSFYSNDVIGAWLNARLLGLSPVFPNRAMFDWAAGLYFADDVNRVSLTSDLISMDILPFGRDKDIKIDTLMSLRRDEDVFVHVRSAVADCRTYLEGAVDESTPPESVTELSKYFLRERLDRYENKSVLRFVTEHPAVGIPVTIAIGAALIPAATVLSAPVALVAGALLTPDLALRVKRRYSKPRKAIGQLQALL